MSRRSIQWLLAELPGLVQAGVLSPDAAESLRRHYTAGGRPASSAVAVVAFGLLGALLIGGGIVLLLAHNWQEIPRLGRSAIALALLLAAQALAGWVLARRPGSGPWREAAGSLLVIAVGASISLVSQTYHTLGDLGGFLQICLLLSLPVIYLMGSRLAAAAIWIGATVWLGATYTSPLATGRLAGYLLLTGLTVPFLVWLTLQPEVRARQALLWVVAPCLAVTPLILLAWRYKLPDIVAVSGLLAGLCAWSLLSGRPGRGSPRQPFLVVGELGIFAFLLVHSYRGVWIDVFRLHTWETALTTTGRLWSWGTAVMLAIPMLLLAAWFLRCRRWPEAGVALLPAVMAAAPFLGRGVTGDVQGAMMLVNVYGLALGLLVFQRGVEDHRLDAANMGLVLVLSLLIARFFDADWSFLARGIGFILLGCTFLGANLWMLKRRRRVEA